MSSLFGRNRPVSPELLTLPAFCVPADEADTLRAKREAQLEWMRNKGVQYLLGNPVTRANSARFPSRQAEIRRVA
jgi:hypothetical protein